MVSPSYGGGMLATDHIGSAQQRRRANEEDAVPGEGEIAA